MPSRPATSNLHLYSKVLDPLHPHLKRSIPECPVFKWETPIFLNISGQIDSQNLLSQRSLDTETEIPMNILRKLESQKGDVRRKYCRFDNIISTNNNILIISFIRSSFTIIVK